MQAFIMITSSVHSLLLFTSPPQIQPRDLLTHRASPQRVSVVFTSHKKASKGSEKYIRGSAQSDRRYIVFCCICIGNIWEHNVLHIPLINCVSEHPKKTRCCFNDFSFLWCSNIPSATIPYIHARITLNTFIIVHTRIKPTMLHLSKTKTKLTTSSEPQTVEATQNQTPHRFIKKKQAIS